MHICNPLNPQPRDMEGQPWIYWKKSVCEWTQAAQTSVVQGSTVNLYNSHTIKFTHWKLVAFNIFTELCNFHHNQFKNSLMTCIYYQSLSHFSKTSGSRKPLTYFLPLWICLCWTLYVNEIIQNVFFVWLSSFLSVVFSWFIHVVAFISSYS